MKQCAVGTVKREALLKNVRREFFRSCIERIVVNQENSGAVDVVFKIKISQAFVIGREVGEYMITNAVENTL